MNREFRKPGLTAQIYLNASIMIETDSPELYKKVKPEVKIIHETYFINDKNEIKKYIQTFCLRESITIDRLKESLKLYEASLAGIQDIDYIQLRLRVQQLYIILCNNDEINNMDKWYKDFLENGYGFDTYEPDEIPSIINAEQKLRETGNAFLDFAVQVLKAPVKYTNAFSGSRPKGNTVGNWLEYDNDWTHEPPQSVTDRMKQFRDAYIKQTELRKEAESKLSKVISNRMDIQDRAFLGEWGKRVVEISDDDDDN